MPTAFLSTALILCTALTGPALAADGTPDSLPSASASADDPVINTAPPEEPEEDVTDVPENSVDESPAEPKPSQEDLPGAVDCSPAHPVYKPISQSKKKYHKGVGPTNSNYNGTSRTGKTTFISEVTGKVGISLNGELETSVSVMLATIKTKYSVTVTAELTAKLGNTFTIDTPPHSTTNGKYGVYRLKHKGQSYMLHQNCTTSPKHTVVSYSPYKVGWYIWEG
ncbi:MULTISPECIES: hypothetical protein [Streptomyces]|uniref:Secreted protein n=1 Tax=Streptomyces avermitilis TaxID=33903 RepID=A0A4D4MX05_STRAX|nr:MULTISPECIES: hypothetical protein [Streptomyces]MYS99806.1 hypothetical protein [Streptomyces sp. SID5469]GDY64244.1 hypothetical protein SAV14893_036370 [Streptomyces avermitilis]GDY75597.1 hypothetical protein SAV31267_050820 [Streptomyces avermitilis]